METKYQVFVSSTYAAALFFENKERFIEAIAQDKAFVYRIFNDIYKKENVDNPYTQEQFRTDAVSIDENLMVIKLLFPEPEKAPLCYYSFLFFDKSSEKINFFCIEKSSIEANPLPHLCGRSADGSHLNYGRGTFEEEDNFLKCVEIYRKQGG